MTTDVVAIVRVTVKSDNGGYFAHSPDLFGLRIWANTKESLDDRIRKGIVLLYKLNHKQTVQVELARDHVTFMKQPVRAMNQFLVAQAA